MENVQKWLQQHYVYMLLDEELNVSHTASVIALVWSDATKAAAERAETEPETFQCEGDLLALPTLQAQRKLLSG